jgi:hypothetical protein
MHNYHNVHRKRSLEAIAVIAILALAGAAEAQVDVGLAPMKVEFPGFAGKSYSGSVVLTNGGATKTRIRVEMADFYIDENTTPQFIAHVPAEAEYSCRSWLRANPMELDVAPMSQIPVRYTLQVPSAASARSYYCALGFRTIPVNDDAATGTGIRTAVRLITTFYATVGKLPVIGVIKDLKLEQVAGTAGPVWRAVVVMENSGLMVYHPLGELTIVDSAGKVVEVEKVPSFPVLPKREQRFLLPLKSELIPGPYTLRARIEVAGEIQEASVVATAVPLPSVETPRVPPVL